jgi:surface protein
MNNVAFQIYGSKKTGIFQSTWDTTLVSALGGEQAAILASGTNWALNTGATNLNVGGYKHTAGSTTNLTTTLGATIMQTYQITYTVSGRTAGSVTINYGGSTTSGITASSVATILATATTVFSITPTSDFDGVISISVKTSSSATNQIKLPLPNSGTYNIWVDWGDGTYNNITSWNQANTLHTYPTPGTYTVRITGDRFSWTNNSDRLKIKTVSSWGKLKIGANSFNGCSNVTMSGITDIPDLTGITSLGSAFANCSKITTVGKMNEWDTSSITNMSSVFNGCTLFNQPIGSWNVSNVTIMSGMFNGSINFNQCIGGWNVTKVTTFEGMFYNCWEFNNGDDSVPLNNWTLNTTAASVSLNYTFIFCKKFNRYIGGWNTSKVNIMADLFNGCLVFNNGFASGIGTGNQMQWNTSSVTNMSNMFNNVPTFNSNLGTGSIPWDVSKVTSFSQTFYGATTFNNGYVSGVENNLEFNTSSATNMFRMFAGAAAFNSNLGTGTTPWDVSKVTSFSQTFYLASKFNNGLASGVAGNMAWNTIEATTMTSMFQGASAFNQNIGAWNVTKVNEFGAMFFGASKFNNGDDSAPINNWNINTVSNVSMNSMFMGASIFNRDISNWNMTKVNHIGFMFDTATAFNQPLGNWERTGSTLGNVTNMRQTFRFTNFFNQDISNWNVNKVTDFGLMFNVAIAFNNGSNSNTNPVTSRTGLNGWNINTAADVSMQGMFSSTRDFNRNINDWNVSKVTNMQQVFNATVVFNQPINSWDTSSVITMLGMFEGAAAFNQPIDNWNVTNVTDMSYMFNITTAFNQPLANWERAGSSLSKVTNMRNMFNQAPSFQQYIGNWNVSGVVNFFLFMGQKGVTNFPSTYLDAIYNGWIVNGVKPNINISFGTAKYTAAGVAGRLTLTSAPNNWIITDGGL